MLGRLSRAHVDPGKGTRREVILTCWFNQGATVRVAGRETLASRLKISSSTWENALHLFLRQASSGKFLLDVSLGKSRIFLNSDQREKKLFNAMRSAELFRP